MTSNEEDVWARKLRQELRHNQEMQLLEVKLELEDAHLQDIEHLTEELKAGRILPEQHMEQIAYLLSEKESRLGVFRAILREGEEEAVKRERSLRRSLAYASADGDADCVEEGAEPISARSSSVDESHHRQLRSSEADERLLASNHLQHSRWEGSGRSSELEIRAVYTPYRALFPGTSNEQGSNLSIPINLTAASSTRRQIHDERLRLNQQLLMNSQRPSHPPPESCASPSTFASSSKDPHVAVHNLGHRVVPEEQSSPIALRKTKKVTFGITEEIPSTASTESPEEVEGYPIIIDRVVQSKGKQISAFSRSSVRFSSLKPKSYEDQRLSPRTTSRELPKQQSANAEGAGEDLQRPEAGSSSMIRMSMGDLGKRTIGREDQATGLRKLIEHLSYFNLSDRIEEVRLADVKLGGTSDVYMGKLKDGTLVSVKKIRIRMFQCLSWSKKIAREMRVWSKLDHVNVLPLLGFILEDNDIPSFIAEWMEYGTVLEYIKKKPQVSAFEMIKGIASGLSYMHSMHVVHGDMKCNNVVVSKAGIPMVMDFGVSHFAQSSSTAESATNADKGTVRWMARELLFPDEDGSRQDGEEIDENRVHTVNSDVWAFGMTILELLTKEVPYHDVRLESNVFGVIYRRRLPRQPDSCINPRSVEGSLWALCQRCWAIDPIQRPSMEFIDHHLREGRDWTSEVRMLQDITKNL